MDLSGLRAELNNLLAEGSFAFGDGEALLELRTELNRFEAIYIQGVGEFDTAGNWADDGATSAAAWIATKANVPAALARREVTRSRKLRQLPMVSEAWSAGDITTSHVDVLLSLQKPRL